MSSGRGQAEFPEPPTAFWFVVAGKRKQVRAAFDGRQTNAGFGSCDGYVALRLGCRHQWPLCVGALCFGGGAIRMVAKHRQKR